MRTTTFLVLLSCSRPPSSIADDPAKTNPPPNANDPVVETPCAPGQNAYLPLGGSVLSIVENPNVCVLYGIDATAHAVLLIDVAADEVRATTSFDSAPRDLSISPDATNVVVALADRLVRLDPETGAVRQELVTSDAPFLVVAANGGRAFYVSKEGYAQIYEATFEGATDMPLGTARYFEPALALTPDGRSLVVGETGTDVRLLRLSLEDGAVSDSYAFDGGFTRPAPKRALHIDLYDRAYFADRVFSLSDLQYVLAWLGGQALAMSPDGGIIATEDGLYDAATYLRFADRPHPSSEGRAVLFSHDGRSLYEVDPTVATLYRTTVAQLLGAHLLGKTSLPHGALSEHSLAQLVLDRDRSRLYGLDTRQNQVLFIDTQTLLPVEAEFAGSAPTHMGMHASGDQLVIATFGATEMAFLELDQTDKARREAAQLPTNPFRIALRGDGAYAYVEQDGASVIRLIDNSGALISTSTEEVVHADLAFYGEALFAGEATPEEARLLKFAVPDDLTTFTLVTEVGEFPARRVVVQGDYVYYGRHRFRADTLEAAGDFPEPIALVSEDGRWALSTRRVFSADASDLTAEVLVLPADSDVLAVDVRAKVIYQFDNELGVLFVPRLPSR